MLTVVELPENLRRPDKLLSRAERERVVNYPAARPASSESRHRYCDIQRDRKRLAVRHAWQGFASESCLRGIPTSMQPVGRSRTNKSRNEFASATTRFYRLDLRSWCNPFSLLFQAIPKWPSAHDWRISCSRKCQCGRCRIRVRDICLLLCRFSTHDWIQAAPDGRDWRSR